MHTVIVKEFKIMMIDNVRDEIVSSMVYVHDACKFRHKVTAKGFKTMMYVMSDMRSVLPWYKDMVHVNPDIRCLTMMFVMSDMRSFLLWSKCMMHVNSDIKCLSKGLRLMYVISDLISLLPCSKVMMHVL